MDTKRALSLVEQARVLQKVRLQRGVLRRQQMADALARGEDLPESPRSRWLFDTASAILECTANCAKEFNDANPDDLISAQDIGDAVATALERIVMHVGGEDS